MVSYVACEKKETGKQLKEWHEHNFLLAFTGCIYFQCSSTPDYMTEITHNASGRLHEVE